MHDDGARLSITAGSVELAVYEYRPDAPAAEAPKPFLHPIRTVSGAPLSIARPWDHRWHKGLQMTWSHVSGQNFWGGPTFTLDEGYVWKENLGRIRHDRFERVDTDGASAVIEEGLSWITSDDRHWFAEARTQRIHRLDETRGSWVLDFSTELRNVSDRELRLGSPTTHGRPDAGYAGLFWRGPRSWTDGAILGGDGAEGEAVMGTVSDWAAVIGQHDEIDGGGTVLMFAGTSSAPVPIRWFSRISPFACLAPSPAFDTEIGLAPGSRLRLAHRVVFIDRRCSRDELEELAGELRP
ncbi:PmoA family protein [Leifsonia sp. ZF2019]|nr:PmoA family protein [Leifsonia sp. ZF2019]